MGIARGGNIIRAGDNVRVAGIAPAGVAVASQVIYRKQAAAQPLVLVASVSAAALTSSMIDTSGANLLIMSIATYSTPTGQPTTDDYGNTWTLAHAAAGSIATSSLFYASAAKTGPNHSFRISGAYAAFQVAAFSGAPAAPSKIATGSSSGRPGPLVVTQPRSLIVTSAGCNTNIASVSGGFTIIKNEPYQAQTMASALAYLWQDEAGTVDPSWTPQAAAQMGSAITALW